MQTTWLISDLTAHISRSLVLNILRMKRLLFSVVVILAYTTTYSQTNKSEILQELEKRQGTDKDAQVTAIIRSATRLFRDKDDLTSVLMVIPKDSVVNVLGSDEKFLDVSFRGIEGYIYASHAEIESLKAVTKPAPRQREQAMDDQQPQQSQRQVQRQKISRFEYLMNKYGNQVATQLYAGKIWKGMTGEMVKDSWGSPRKINRVISGNNIREEWIYQNTWLYLQNDELVQWGPVR